MSYFLWEEFCLKYPKMAQDFDASRCTSYSPLVCANLDGLLGARYTTPFTPTPLMVKDLAMDLCYWQLTYKESDQTLLKDYIDERITGLVNGTITLNDASGSPIAGTPRVFLTTSGTNTSFGMDNEVNYAVDSSWQQSFRGDRGQF